MDPNRLVVYFAALTLCVACNSRTDLEGEIFIVTKGRDNIEMGLVDVRAYNSDSLEAYLDNRHLTSQRRSRGYLSKLEDIVDTTRALFSRYQEARREMDEALEASEKSVGDFDGSFEMAQERFDTALNSYMDLSNKVGSIRSDVSVLLDSLVAVRGQHYYLENLPRPRGSTKTDSDGAFTLTLVQGVEYTLVAAASRQVGSDTEQYVWAVDISPSETVMMSNDNTGGLVSDGYALPPDYLRAYRNTVVELIESGRTIGKDYMYKLLFPRKTSADLPDSLRKSLNS